MNNRHPSTRNKKGNEEDLSPTANSNFLGVSNATKALLNFIEVDLFEKLIAAFYGQPLAIFRFFVVILANCFEIYISDKSISLTYLNLYFIYFQQTAGKKQWKRP